ncbi:MAG TPA: PSD1 and planctomycete cytochrome C domain-containing protein, partial [Chthonomonadaceae bacterium]|nr:PSD1 and planctomycete cytochrome C domain-containing protein [Chthonomonadaceae bacterium]
MPVRPLHTLFAALIVTVGAPAALAQAKTPAHGPAETADSAAAEMFEKKIRPALAQNCYECHSQSAGKSLGGLTLDTRAGLLKGGSRGTGLVPGHPDKSLLIEAITYSRPDLKMPPKGKLPESVIADLTEWVRHGAVWPADSVPAARSASGAADKLKRSHWAWQPVRKVAPPPVKRAAWPQNAIDRFVLAKLEAKGLTPQPKADRRTLIRRAYFDLIGLPPTPEQVDAFLNDRSPDAWRKVIDGLLASPHYGERWGRYWLDVARYGEDQAHSFEPRLYPQGFRFRDWIARSLNADMPYDRFVKEQIAADLLEKDSPDKMQQLPALGFFATGPVYYGDSKMLDQYDDRIDTLSRGFLGLTVACARCHDHKFDPITQKDYYALAGIFASTSYVEVALADGGGDGKAGANRQELIKAKQAEVDKFTAEHVARLRGEFAGQIGRYVVAAWKLQNRRKTDSKASLDAVATAETVDPVMLDRWLKFLSGPESKGRPLLAGWRRMVEQQDPRADQGSAPMPLADARKVGADLQEDVQALMRRAGIGRRSGAKVAKLDGPAANDPAAPLSKEETAELDEIAGDKGVLTVPVDVLDRFLTGDPKAHYAVIKPELERLKMGAFVHALAEGPKPANVHVLLRGNPDTPGEEAPRRFLGLLAGDGAPAFTQGSGRLELANAIADKSNPLTARVIVNRVWQHHFGRGIVRTASNFGLLGEPPTHPELLDYLAAEFVEHGWSIKALHREIMLSATYQTSSAVNRKGDDIDPDDRLLWHMPRRRLDVEAWRDAMLAASGKLDPTIGGPSQPLASPDN